jgi:hypothetical protein
MQGNWVVKIGGQMPRIEVTGDICLRRQRSTQGCKASDDDNGPEEPTHVGILIKCGAVNNNTWSLNGH